MPARSGEAYLRGLAEPRDIWVDGERVSNVVDHPALSGAARTIASVYDFQQEQADTCLTPDPETGEAISLSHMIPRSKEDLYRRRRCLEEISELTAGLMGRTPDYLNVTFAGFAGEATAWRAFGNEAGAERLVAYQTHLRRADLSLTHAIVSPAADKALGDMSRPGDEITLRKSGDRRFNGADPGLSERDLCRICRRGYRLASVWQRSRCGTTGCVPNASTPRRFIANPCDCISSGRQGTGRHVETWR